MKLTYGILLPIVSITSTMFVGLKLYKNEPNKYNVIFSTIDGRRKV